MLDLSSISIGVVGLGYVGLPLAAELGHRYKTIGFDINAVRVAQLNEGTDVTQEVSQSALAAATQLSFTTAPDDLAECDVYIVTIPTPVDEARRPDLEPLKSASRTIGKVISPNNVVIYESTVYPGATEEICIPEIERVSGLHYNVDFFAGYSPERINPGDREHRLATIVKVTSGSTDEVADFVDRLYASIISAGTHRASSIAVAEAAKVIENTQRDINIALINELAMIFERLDLDTGDVLAAAGTKWNFLPFKAGLVGGHCIGVDPYYLTHKAQTVGYHPEVILAGRRINDQMGTHVADRVIKLMAERAINLVGAKVLVLGFAFKANCPDTRNTKVIDIYQRLASYHLAIDVYDPWVDRDEVRDTYNIEMITEPAQGQYDAVILAVGHDTFKEIDVAAMTRPVHVTFDVAHQLPRNQITERL